MHLFPHNDKMHDLSLVIELDLVYIYIKSLIFNWDIVLREEYRLSRIVFQKGERMSGTETSTSGMSPTSGVRPSRDAGGLHMENQISTWDFTALKRDQQHAWASGDYSMIAATLVPISERLCEAVDLHAGQRVLDVATGCGNTALAAACRGCDVIGIDFVPALLERGQEQAVSEGLSVTFQEGDAEQIPFPDASFDVVLSTFGVMFAPNQEQAARELLRVCRGGGKIGLANWTQDSYSGQLGWTIGLHVPSLAGLKPPFLWGMEERLRELFGEDITSLQVRQRSLVLCARSEQDNLKALRTYFGPVIKAYEALDAQRQKRLTHDLLNLFHRFNRSGDEMMAVSSDYLEVVATRR